MQQADGLVVKVREANPVEAAQCCQCRGERWRQLVGRPAAAATAAAAAAATAAAAAAATAAAAAFATAAAAAPSATAAAAAFAT